MTKRLKSTVLHSTRVLISVSNINGVVRSPTPFGLGRNGCWPSRGSQLPRALPFFFSLCCPPNDRRRAAHSFYIIGRLLSLFLFSCPSLALLCLLILLLLLMSGNVHPNPGTTFPCSVCTRNVTWRGKSVQCCTCSKWVHLRCSTNLNSSSSFRIPGFSDLRSDRTHSRSGILSPDAMHVSGGVVIFVRQGLSFSELSTSTLSSLDPYSDYAENSISLNNCSSLSFINVYAPPLFAPPQWMAESTPSLPSFFPPSEISSFLGTSIAITPSGI